jgi:hypothetical protein
MTEEQPGFDPTIVETEGERNINIVRKEGASHLEGTIAKLS